MCTIYSEDTFFLKLQKFAEVVKASVYAPSTTYLNEKQYHYYHNFLPSTLELRLKQNKRDLLLLNVAISNVKKYYISYYCVVSFYEIKYKANFYVIVY